MKTESKLTKHQRKTYTAEWTEDGKPFAVVAEVRYDDQCGNGHNTFAITGTVYSLRGDRRDGKHYNKAGQALYVDSGPPPCTIHDLRLRRLGKAL